MFPSGDEQVDGVSLMKKYQEQVDTMGEWFDQWTESGRMVVLMKLMTRISPACARLVITALEDSVSDSDKLTAMEKRANNPVFIYNLLDAKKEEAMAEILKHVPLLQPGNNRVVQSYLKVVPLLLGFCLENGVMLDQAVQLLVFVLIHPVLKNFSRNFECWHKLLGEKIVGMKNQEVAVSNSAEQFEVGADRPLSRSTPAAAPVGQLWISQTGQFLRDRQPYDDASGFQALGMSDVKPWLKSLRLHKYWPHFSQLTYAEMLGLTEETFETTMSAVEAGPITHGARRKILLTMAKMRDRCHNLRLLEQELKSGQGRNLLSAMDEVKAILLTPIKLHEEEDESPDLPHQLLKVLFQVKQKLLHGSVYEDEAFTSFVSLLDSAIRLEAFTIQQKRQLSLCRQHTIEYHQQVKNLQQRRVVMEPAPRPLTPRHQPQRPVITMSWDNYLHHQTAQIGRAEQPDLFAMNHLEQLSLQIEQSLEL